MALVLSLLLHLGLYGGWCLGKQYGWWNQHPAWLTQLTRKLAQAAAARERKPKPVVQERSIPMTFLEVDPDTATTEAPKDTKYYSSRNSKASNPDPNNQEVPKVDGKQEQVVRLMDNEKPKPFPLQPLPKPPQPDPPAEAKPKQPAPGDLAIVRPREVTPPTDGALDPAIGRGPFPRPGRPKGC